ncbi:hypothetical protein PMAYCL1PPCAC_32135, partial [Pristionchus mayeri]
LYHPSKMTSIFSTLVLASIVGLSAAQCGTRGNHPNCASWNRVSNFCTNSAYSLEIRQTYCPTFCANLGCTTTTTTTTAAPGVAAGTDGNANCAKWAADTTNPFCVSTTITTEMKTMFCAKTCEFEITPNADCALYTVTRTAFARGTPSSRTNAPGTVVASGAAAGTTLSRVFANTGCTVKLFTAADAGGDTSKGELETHVGTATEKFFTVQAANNAALSYTCVCV